MYRKNSKQEIKEWINRGMWGLVPIYGKDGGNCTKIIFENRPPVIIERRIHTILVKFAAIFQKDIRLIREQAREITGQRSMNPLPINADIILVPFKMRKPVGKDDGALGYFFSSAIENILEGANGARVILKDGQDFDVLDTFVTAKHHMGYAHQIYYHLHKHDMSGASSYNICRECAGIYDQPATKGDIANLSRNIGKLVYKLDKLQK